MDNATESYIRHFTTECILPHRTYTVIGQKTFLAPAKDRRETKDSCVYTGEYLGEKRNNKYIPSIFLLDRIQKHTTQWIRINQKAEWLVICGRDVWGTSITHTGCSLAHDMRVLVCNMFDEVLGVGRVVEPDRSIRRVCIKMQFDIGDFLRRERHKRRRA